MALFCKTPGYHALLIVPAAALLSVLAHWLVPHSQRSRRQPPAARRQPAQRGGAWLAGLVLCLPTVVWAVTPEALHSYEAGLDARARGDFQAAALAFEQALMLDPTFAGAWFDYGTALCDLGDPIGCRNILTTAISQFGLPPALQQTLGQVLRVQQGEVRLGLGASTNLLRATGADDLTLLLDGVEVRALLADGYRERGGGLAESAFSYQSTWPLHNITARIDLLGRRPFDTNLPSLRAGYAEIGVGLDALGLERFGFNSRSRAGLLALSVNEGYLGGLSTAGFWAEHQLSPEGTVVRAALERRKPRDQAGWYTTRLSARVPLQPGWRLGAGVEYDTPQAERAGYAQTRFLADIRHERSLPALGGRTPRLTLEASALHARDARAYSALFGGQRNVRTRWQLSADISVNLNRQWRVGLELLAARQTANIVLFDYRELSAMMSVTYRFD